MLRFKQKCSIIDNKPTRYEILLNSFIFAVFHLWASRIHNCHAVFSLSNIGTFEINQEFFHHRKLAQH